MKNYHTHTPRCKHAIGNEEDYIKAAIQAGYTELGFSDHTPWHYSSGYKPTMRMEESELSNYVSTLLRLKEKYKDQISIKIGLECEYFKEKMDWLQDQLKKYSIDYIILGNHYDGSDETGIYYGYPQVSLSELKRYVSQVIQAMDTGLFSYVAHPDVVYYDQNNPMHLQELEKICIHAAKSNIPLEFNLLGYKAQRHYPSKPFIKLCQKYKNHMIIGVDAHEPEALLDLETYQRAYNYLESQGLTVVENIKMLK